jgi:acetylornithine deacetylase/succinyl-diaminopimelate desuccinylase-like protein
MAPEEGRSAIAAAARAIADMRLGRLDDETSANVGTIEGGVARNIVPDRCSFSAEARSHDESRLSDTVQELLDACSFAASLTGCEVETQVERGFRGYRFGREDGPVRLARAALERSGYVPTFRHSQPAGAHRRRGPRGHGRGDARARRRGTWRLASPEASSRSCSSGTRDSSGSRWTGGRASPIRP